MANMRENWLEERLDAAFEAMENLENGNPTSWNGVGWDGNWENSYGYDCVYSAINEDIDEIMMLLGYDEEIDDAFVEDFDPESEVAFA